MHGDLTHEPSACKIRRFEMTKYTFEADEEYMAIKELEHINHSETNMNSVFYQELFFAKREPEDSLIMGDEHLDTILEKESDELIKSSVENLVPIPSESEDFFDNESECDEASPIFTTFSNPLFDSNEDFTSSDDESLSDEDVPMENFKIYSNPLFDDEEIISPKIDPHYFNADLNLISLALLNCEEDVPKETFKIYSNPLFEFDDDFTSSDVNPLFNEVLEDIECKVSYDSNLDESTFLVTPISDSNEDECLAPGDDIELLLHHDPSTPIISIVSILEGFIDEPPLEENDDLFDLESKENKWKNILYDDLMTEDKVFDPEIHEKSFSPTLVKLTFEDRHYFPITFVIRIFLPYLTYSVDSPFLLSSRSEETIFDPGISTFHFSSLKPVAYENPMVIFPFFCFCPKDKGIRGESS
ncbi:hypothetical protein Tco_0327685 [Tanacetum coccineum]